MSGIAGRIVGAALAMTMLPLALPACSSIVSGSDPVRDCGYSVTWNEHIYVSLIYALHKPQTRADVIEPNTGRKVGRGFVPQCPGDSTGEPATVYAINGISTDLAVMASTGYDSRPILCIRKGQAIPEQLLVHP